MRWSFVLVGIGMILLVVMAIVLSIRAAEGDVLSLLVALVMIFIARNLWPGRENEE